MDDQPAKREKKTAPCPNCGKAFAVQAMQRHVRACLGLQVQATQEEIAKRRETVWNLRLNGASTAAMAKLLNVSVNTILDDVRARRHQMMEELATTSAAERTAEALQRLETLEHQASQDYTSLNVEKEPLERLSAHRELRDTVSAVIKFKQDTGLLPKKADELKLIAGEKDYRAMSRPALEAERLAVMKRLESYGKQIALPAPADVPLVVTDGPGDQNG